MKTTVCKKLKHAVLLLGVCSMTLIAASSVQAASLSTANLNMKLGKTQTVKLNKAKGAAKWKLKLSGVVKMKKKGAYAVKLTAKSVGQTYLTCKNKGKTYTCKITVSAPTITSGKKIYSETPVLTGYEDIDYLIEYHLKKAGIKEGMTEKQAVLQIWCYIAEHMRYPEDMKKHGSKVGSPVSYTDAEVDAYSAKCDALEEQGKLKYDDTYATVRCDYGSWELSEEHGVARRLRVILEEYTGTCTENSNLFTIMCNHIGIKAGKVAGREYGEDHTWSWAVVNGAKRYYDMGAAVHGMGRKKGFSTASSVYAIKKENQKKYKLIEKMEW